MTTYLATDTTLTATSGSTAAFNIVGILIGVVLVLAITVVVIAGMWKAFVKAGKPGWAAIIPVYNTWVMAEIGGKPGWWGLYPLLGIIPFVGALAALVIALLIALEVARSFGKSTVFGVFGLWLFSAIGYIILGFGDAKYSGPVVASGSPAPQPVVTPVDQAQPPATPAPVDTPQPPANTPKVSG